MDELIARLGEATEGSRELDMAIHKAVTENYNQYDTIPAYTDYIDAALSLVPEGWRIPVLGEGANGRWYAEAIEREGLGFIRDLAGHASPAVSLCIACLRARSTQERG